MRTVADVIEIVKRAFPDRTFEGPTYDWLGKTEVILDDKVGSRKTVFVVELSLDGGIFRVALRLEPLRHPCVVVKTATLGDAMTLASGIAQAAWTV